MPNVRLDSAPRIKATNVVMTSAATTATQGLRPSFRPLLPAFGDTVADDEPGHAVREQLSQRHHPAIRGQEDNAWRRPGRG